MPSMDDGQRDDPRIRREKPVPRRCASSDARPYPSHRLGLDTAWARRPLAAEPAHGGRHFLTAATFAKADLDLPVRAEFYTKPIHHGDVIAAMRRMAATPDYKGSDRLA